MMRCFDHDGLGRGRGKEEIKKSLQSSSLEERDCACVQQHGHQIWQRTGDVYSRTQPLPFPWKSPHTWQAITLGKKKDTTIFCTFRAEALTNITSESPTPHSSNGAMQAYTPEWAQRVPIAPGNNLPGSSWLRAVRNTTRAMGREPASGGHAPKRTKILHVFSSEGRRQENAGNKAALLGHVAWSGDREAEDWSFWFSSTWGEETCC